MAEPRYTLTAGAVFRDESKWLAEWIEYHRLVGVEHFYLADDNHTQEERDRSAEVLRPYVESGLVDCFRLRAVWDFQSEAYNLILRNYGAQSKWMAVIDLDEFLFPVAAVSVPEVLVFGSAGLEDSPALQTEAFVCRAEKEHRLHRTMKMVIRPDRILFWSGHLPVPLPGFQTVDECLDRVTTTKGPVRLSRLRLHHYATRSLADWQRKATRGFRSTAHKYWPESVWRNRFAKLDCNDVEDLSMERYVPELRRRLGLA